MVLNNPEFVQAANSQQFNYYQQSMTSNDKYPITGNQILTAYHMGGQQQAKMIRQG